MARILITRIMFIFWLMLLSLSISAYAGITEGIQYLSNQVQQDSSYASELLSIATHYQSTAEALDTFYVLNETQQSGIPSALEFLQNESFQGTEYLSRLIIAQVEYGQVDSILLSRLKSYQNQDGGFGEMAGFQSTSVDTAFALRAIQAANLANQEVALKAMSYLLLQQRNDGGWSNGKNLSQSYVTALCIQVLAPYAKGYQNVLGTITLGQTYLYSQRAENGLWGEDYQSASVILALIATAADLRNKHETTSRY